MQQQQDDIREKWKRNFNFAWWLCVMHQRGLVIIMRNKWGKEALGTPCALALVVMCVWATFSRDPFMWAWVGIWMLCFIARRMESVRLERQGEKIHSWYDGWPHDTYRYCKSEKTAKLVVEPILVGILGGFLYWIYTEQGWSLYGLPYYVLAGMFTLPFVEMVKQSIWRKRSQAMIDAKIEQEQLMQDMRDRWGDS